MCYSIFTHIFYQRSVMMGTKYTDAIYAYFIKIWNVEILPCYYDKTTRLWRTGEDCDMAGIDSLMLKDGSLKY